MHPLRMPRARLTVRSSETPARGICSMPATASRTPPAPPAAQSAPAAQRLPWRARGCSPPPPGERRGAGGSGSFCMRATLVRIRGRPTSGAGVGQKLAPQRGLANLGFEGMVPPTGSGSPQAVTRRTHEPCSRISERQSGRPSLLFVAVDVVPLILSASLAIWVAAAAAALRRLRLSPSCTCHSPHIGHPLSVGWAYFFAHARCPHRGPSCDASGDIIDSANVDVRACR